MTRSIHIVLLCALATPAHAQAPPAHPERGAPPDGGTKSKGEIIIITGERPAGPGDLVSDSTAHPDAARALSDPAFVTVVRVDDRAGETTTVAEVLADTLGTQVRSLGGLGSFSSLSVRGAASGHTAIFVDGVPLSRIASAGADLGRFELGSFSTVELHRGGVPVELGGAALGGALDLITRVGPPANGRRLRVDAGAGSFGARHLGVRWIDGRADGSLGWHLAGRYAGAAGDFTYFDDRGTNLNPSDDATVERSNNGYDQADAVARLAAAGADTRVRAGVRASARRQGVPGSASVQSMTARLATATAAADAAVDRERLAGNPGLAGGAAGFVIAELQEYRDLDGEIGLATQHRRYRTVGGGARGRLAWAAPGGHRLSTAIDGGGDWFTDTDLADGGAGRGRGLRLATGVALADDWRAGGGDRVVVQPALRVDVLHTNPLGSADSPIGGEVPEPTRTEVHPSPRLAARVALAPALAAKGSAGRYFRAPTVVELYGDRGWVIGNPGLRAETGATADLGLVWAPDRRLGPVDRLYVEAAGFAARPRDAIVYVPTAGLTAVPRNLGRARILGVETAVSARFGATATVSANYTLLDTRQRSEMPSHDGRRLPQRPRHALYARVDSARRIARRLIVLWADASLTAGNYLDPGNVAPVPARRLFGAGFKFEPLADLLLGVEVANLADQRIETIPLDPPPRPDLTEVPRAVSDFFGYPLAGRAVYLRAEWTH